MRGSWRITRPASTRFLQGLKPRIGIRRRGRRARELVVKLKPELEKKWRGDLPGVLSELEERADLGLLMKLQSTEELDAWVESQQGPPESTGSHGAASGDPAEDEGTDQEYDSAGSDGDQGQDEEGTEADDGAGGSERLQETDIAEDGEDQSRQGEESDEDVT